MQGSETVYKNPNIVMENPYIIPNRPSTPPQVSKKPKEVGLPFRTPQGGQKLRNQVVKKRGSNSVFICT